MEKDSEVNILTKIVHQKILRDLLPQLQKAYQILFTESDTQIILDIPEDEIFDPNTKEHDQLLIDDDLF